MSLEIENFKKVTILNLSYQVFLITCVCVVYNNRKPAPNFSNYLRTQNKFGLFSNFVIIFFIETYARLYQGQNINIFQKVTIFKDVGVIKKEIHSKWIIFYHTNYLNTQRNLWGNFASNFQITCVLKKSRRIYWHIFSNNK